MSTIQLHTPTYMQDDKTVTEYDANNIVHIVSVVGDDEAQGTHFYLRDIAEKQFCLEPAKVVKNLVAANKDAPNRSVIAQQFNLHGPVQGNIIVTTGNHNLINLDSVQNTQNHQFNEAVEQLRTVVSGSDLDAVDKDEISHTLDRVRKLSEGEPTQKSKSSALEKLALVEKIVTVSEKLAKIAGPLILILQNHMR